MYTSTFTTLQYYQCQSPHITAPTLSIHENVSLNGHHKTSDSTLSISIILQGVIPSRGKSFSSTKHPDQLHGPPSLSMGTRGNMLVNDAYRLPEPCTSTPPKYPHSTHRDNFTITYVLHSFTLCSSSHEL